MPSFEVEVHAVIKVNVVAEDFQSAADTAVAAIENRTEDWSTLTIDVQSIGARAVVNVA